ncbi:hypothetical protein [Francisella philomiragia]|uniref:hypothetical protein n=1 Tax=Francisella philomiragia TaxID=28110 RepID=UPI003517FB38
MDKKLFLSISLLLICLIGVSLGQGITVNSPLLLKPSSQKLLNKVQTAFNEGFNNSKLSAEETANKYFSKDLKFYAGDTGKIITYNSLINRFKAVRREYKSVNILIIDAVFSTNGTHSSLSETHLTIGLKKNGTQVFIKTNNIISFDKEGKITKIYNVEESLGNNIAEATHDAYMTK